MIWLLSLREWQRRPLRMSISTLGVALAVAALWSLLAFGRGYRDGVQDELDHLGAHVLLVPKGCPYDATSLALHGASWPCYLKAAYLSQVRAVPGVAKAAPVLMNAFIDDSGAQTVYLGVDSNLLALKTGWHLDGRFPAVRGDLLLGADVARKHDWHLGQTVALPGLKGARGTVGGILAPSQSADDGFIYTRLSDAQTWFGRRGELTHVLVRLRDPDRLDDVVAQLRGCGAGLEMNIVPLSHVFHSIEGLVNATRALLLCTVMVALLVAGAGVSNTLMMAVSERTREIGVMRALGATHGEIFRVFWAQALQLCGVGAIAGVSTACTAARETDAWLRAQLPYSPHNSMVHSDWPTTLACILGAMLLGTMAGALPAWRASCLAPSVAMRARGERA